MSKVEIIGFDSHASHLKRREVGVLSGSLKVYNDKLVTIDDGINNLELQLASVTDKLDTLTVRQTTVNSKVKVTSDDGISVYADTSPAPTADVNERQGWLWHKVADDASKFNYYFYGYTGSSHQYTLGDFRGAHAVTILDNYQSTASVPFIIVYTKPLGAGDAGAWFHSKRTYKIGAGEKLMVGEPINLYAGQLPVVANANRYVPLSTLTVDGDGLDAEEILAITIHSDSAALTDTRVLVSSLGYNLADEIHQHVDLVH